MRFRAPESSTYMLITPALDGIKSYTSVIAQLINPIVFSIKRLTFAAKITFFFSKLPRKKQKFCKSSAKSPEICKIPNRTGQDLRHLRIENRRPKGKPNLRDPTLNDRIGQKKMWEPPIRKPLSIFRKPLQKKLSYTYTKSNH